MRRMRTWGAALALAATALLGGCSDSLGPEELPGVYALEEVNGQDLPFGLVATGTTNRAIEGGEMTLSSAGVAQVRLNLVNTTGSSVERFQEVYNGTWEAGGSGGVTITITSPSRQTAARIDGSTVRLLIAHSETEVREYYFRK